MSQAIVNPGELRHVSAALRETAQELRSQHMSIMHAFNALSATWKDRRYTKFEQSFNEVTTHLWAFYALAEVQADHLRMKADAAQRYLDGR
jgi:hypothetical protein